MKIRQFLATLLLLVGAVALGGCSDDDDPYYHSVPGGGFAYRANTVHFYYIGEDGNSLIEQSLPATYPLPCEDKEAQLPVPEVDEYGYYSSGNWTSCQIAVDEDGTPYFKCYFPIDKSTDTYTFYVYSNGSFDHFELTYGYTNDGVGGDGWIAHVLSLKINGQHVYSDEERRDAESADCKVYLRKSAAGTQEVWSEYD